MLLLNGFGELSDCPSCLIRHTKNGLLCVFLTWVMCLCCFLTCSSVPCSSVEVQMCTFMCLLCSVICPQPPECPCATIAYPGGQHKHCSQAKVFPVYYWGPVYHFNPIEPLYPFVNILPLRASCYFLLKYFSGSVQWLHNLHLHLQCAWTVIWGEVARF